MQMVVLPEGLEIEVTRTTYVRNAGYFTLGNVAYEVITYVYGARVLWGNIDEEIAQLSYAFDTKLIKKPGFRLFSKAVRELEFILDYSITPHRRGWGKIINKFLSDFWGIKEDEDFITHEIVSLIYPYVLGKAFNLVYQSYFNSSLVRLRVVFIPEKEANEYKFKVDKIEWLDCLGKDLNPESPAEIDLSYFLNKIYHTSVYTIDIPVANLIICFGLSVASKLLQKFMTAVSEDTSFISINQFVKLV